jgi:hypothetical protein
MKEELAVLLGITLFSAVAHEIDLYYIEIQDKKKTFLQNLRVTNKKFVD